MSLRMVGRKSNSQHQHPHPHQQQRPQKKGHFRLLSGMRKKLLLTNPSQIPSPRPPRYSSGVAAAAALSSSSDSSSLGGHSTDAVRSTINHSHDHHQNYQGGLRNGHVDGNGNTRLNNIQKITNSSRRNSRSESQRYRRSTTRRQRTTTRRRDDDDCSSIASNEEDSDDHGQHQRETTSVDFDFGFDDDDFDLDDDDDNEDDDGLGFGPTSSTASGGGGGESAPRRQSHRKQASFDGLSIDEEEESLLLDAVDKLWSGSTRLQGGGDATTVAGSSSAGTHSSPAQSYGSRGGPTAGSNNDKNVWKFIPTENSVNTRMSRVKSKIAKEKLSFKKLKLFGRSAETKQLVECLERVIPPRTTQSIAPSPPPKSTPTLTASFDTDTDDADADADQTDPFYPQLVLVSGVAGVGKRILIDYIERRMPRNKTNGMFLCGTFRPSMTTNTEQGQLQQHAAPYSAIACTCQKLCGKLLRMSKSDRPNWCKLRAKLIQKIGPVPSNPQPSSFTSCSSISSPPSCSDDWRLLFQLMPELEELVMDTGKTCHCPKTDDEWNHTASTTQIDGTNCRLHDIFGMFLDVVISDEGLCSYIVFSFEDLHFADEASLDLISSMTFYQGTRILVLGTYRSDELKSAPLLQASILNMRGEGSGSDDESRKTAPSSRGILTEIEITDFSEEQVRDMLAILLDNKPSLSEFASFCYRRTGGNIKQLKFFLRSLQTKEILTFNVIDWAWEWDMNEMISRTCSMDNVLDDLIERMIYLPRSVQQRLSTASFLGSVFDPSIESIVSTNLPNHAVSSSSEDDSWLMLVEDQGILEPTRTETGIVAYKWAHSHLQEVSADLISQQEYTTIKLDIAKVLLHDLCQEQQEMLVCTIADLLVSYSGEVEGISSIRMAEIYCLASKKASEQVSYESMYAYSNAGIHQLPDGKWSDHYQLSLDLHTYATQSAATLGLDEEMVQLYTKIIQLDEISVVDKTAAYKAVIKNRAVPVEVVDFAKQSLAKFGLNFPSGKVQRSLAITRLLINLKRRIHKLNPIDIVEWPETTDHIKLCAMNILCHSTNAVSSMDDDLARLWVLTFGRYALDSGMSMYLPLAFAQLGVVFSSTNDRSTATKCGEMIDALSAALPEACGETCSETIAHASAFVFAFSSPYHTVRKPLMTRGYANGLLLGQKSGVEMCLNFYLYMSFFSSCPLRSVESDCRKYMQQDRNLSFRRGEVEHTGKSIAMLLQCTLNLLGRSSDDPLVLCGDAIADFEEYQLTITDETGKCLLLMFHQYLCMIFGAYIKGAELALANEGKFEKAMAGMFLTMPETFSRGVNLFAAARMTGKKKYRRAAKNALKITRKWASENNPNVQHQYQFFLAELSALDGQHETAEILYHRALSQAKRAGFVSDAAIISERSADFYKCCQNSQDDAQYKMEESCRLYTEWGCKVKSDMLWRKHDRDYAPPPIPSFIALPIEATHCLKPQKSLEPNDSMLAGKSLTETSLLTPISV